MTLGGLALAVGILVDDATVTIENIERFLEQGYALREAILEGASQISVPALVSTLCICIVFLPMFFLGGVARYLFVPLAEAVVFAMLASYLLSRTLVPTLAMYLLRAKEHGAAAARGFFARFQQGFERAFDARARAVPIRCCRDSSSVAAFSFLRSSGFVSPSSFLCRSLAKTFSLRQTAGSSFSMCAPPRECALKKRRACSIWLRTRSARKSRLSQIDNILDNIGLPYSAMNTQHLTNGTLGAGDGDILVSLKPNHGPTADYVRALRRNLPRMFPAATSICCPPTSRRRFSTSDCRRPSTSRLKATMRTPARHRQTSFLASCARFPA